MTKGPFYNDLADRITRPKLEDEFITSNPIKDSTTTLVVLTTSGSSGMIKDAETGAYRGLFGKAVSRGLQELKMRCSVTITAIVKAPNALSIVVYGLSSESETVGDILLGHDLYLQLPNSFDVLVQYQNPQSFSIGNSMVLDKPVREAKDSYKTTVTMLNAFAKSEVNELLDSATGPEEFQEVQASTKLITKLKTLVSSCSLFCAAYR